MGRYRTRKEILIQQARQKREWEVLQRRKGLKIVKAGEVSSARS